MEPINTEIVVVGGGPGGYTAAFYAADLGKKVILVERDKRLGGVCLNRGCIPSKALLNAAHSIVEAREAAHRGITFGPPQVDVVKLRAWKDSIVQKLCGGIAMLAEKRGVQVIYGRGYFEGSQSLRVEREHGQQFINFEHAIIATGSKSAMPKAFDLGNPRIMTSTEALDTEDVPESLLVVGGGYIGLELGTVYATLGSKVVLVEALDSILLGADPDLARHHLLAAIGHRRPTLQLLGLAFLLGEGRPHLLAALARLGGRHRRRRHRSAPFLGLAAFGGRPALGRSGADCRGVIERRRLGLRHVAVVVLAAQQLHACQVTSPRRRSGMHLAMRGSTLQECRC